MTSPDAPPARRPRLLWIDLLRGAAVLFMIETHVVNTFLDTGLRTGPSFAWASYFNGLVAPTFLFLAGYMQGMARRVVPRKPIDYPRHAGRLLGLVAIGYALHLPWEQFGRREWVEALRIGSQVDVLQCIGAALGLLLGLAWLTERRGDRAWWLGVGVLGAAVVLVAPFTVGWMGGVVPVRAWVNFSTGSWFPLFPWAGFVLLGALVGAARVGAWWGRGVVMAGLVLAAWVLHPAEYSRVSVSSFLLRSAWVLAFTVVAEWVAGWWAPRLLLFAGKHSLLLYVLHLVLISRLAGGVVPAERCSGGVVLGLWAGVTGASLLGTLLVVRGQAWRAAGSRWPWAAKGATVLAPLPPPAEP
jgi:uncharacterized membrane protein